MFFGEAHRGPGGARGGKMKQELKNEKNENMKK